MKPSAFDTGNVFDAVGERKRTSYHIERNQHWLDESFEIKLRNQANGDQGGRAPIPLEQLGDRKEF